MIKSCIARTVAVAVFLTIPATAFAQEREPVTARVDYAGLDLATASGQATFKHRLHMVAARSCQSGISDRVQASIDVSRCRNEMERDGAVNLAALALRPTNELASSDKTK